MKPGTLNRIENMLPKKVINQVKIAHKTENIIHVILMVDSSPLPPPSFKLNTKHNRSLHSIY